MYLLILEPKYNSQNKNRSSSSPPVQLENYFLRMMDSAHKPFIEKDLTQTSMLGLFIAAKLVLAETFICSPNIYYI